MSSSTIEKSVTIYRGDDEVLLFSGVGPVTGLITLQVAAAFGGATLLQSTSVDGEHGADHAAGKLAFPITAGQSASLPADSMLAYDVKIVDAGVTRSPFYGVFRVAGSITQTEFPVGMSANDVLSFLSDSSDSSKGAGLIGVLQSFWSGVGFAGPFRLQDLLQWLYSKITPRIDPQTGGKLVKTVGTAGAIGESGVSESSGVLDAAGYLEGGNPFLGEHTTDELPEGAANRYYTSARENAKANVDLSNVLNTDFYDKAVAAGAVGGGVASFNSRTGAVTPQAGDYSASQVSATETGDLSGVTVQAQLEDLDTRIAAVSLSSIIQPGRFVVAMPGRRRAASSANPWHPIAVTRTFTQAAAPDFFSALYGEYFIASEDGPESFAITAATHTGGQVSGAQSLAFTTGTPGIGAIINAIFERARVLSYQSAIPGIGPGSSATRDRLNGTVDASTDQITTSVNHLMPTGWPVYMYTGISGDAQYGVKYYVRSLGAALLSLHPTEADAVANTNKINFTSNGAVALHVWLAKAGVSVCVNEAIGHVPVGNYEVTRIAEDVAGYHYILIAGTGTDDSGVVAGDIRFSYHRVAGSTTSVIWHAIEDAAIMTPREDGSIANGTMQLDQMQGHRHNIGTADNGGSASVTVTTTGTGSGFLGGITEAVFLYVGDARSDGTNGPPRTSATTQPRNVRWDSYVYVGANTLS